jgi:hypothetical protein
MFGSKVFHFTAGILRKIILKPLRVRHGRSCFRWSGQSRLASVLVQPLREHLFDVELGSTLFIGVALHISAVLSVQLFLKPVIVQHG